MLKEIKRILRRVIFRKTLNRQRRETQIQFKRCEPWFKVKGDETLRLDYNLNEASVVFDLGGYKGEFANSIYNKYGATVYIFEPVPVFFNCIVDTFKTNNKIKAYSYGLAGKEAKVQISSTDDSSSVYIKGGASQTITLKPIVDFIKQHSIDRIQLIKINIEGGEYEVLEALLDNGMISIFDNIQVQFHDFIIENAKGRMQAIQDKLAITHELTYQYEFVWENWKIKQ